MRIYVARKCKVPVLQSTTEGVQYCHRQINSSSPECPALIGERSQFVAIACIQNNTELWT